MGALGLGALSSHLQEAVVLLGEVEVDEAHVAARDLVPRLHAHLQHAAARIAAGETGESRGAACERCVGSMREVRVGVRASSSDDEMVRGVVRGVVRAGCTSGEEMGVSEEQPSSTSILRRERLSTMTTSCPWSDRCSAVGQPQKPSPPSTKTFFLPPSLATGLVGDSGAAAAIATREVRSSGCATAIATSAGEAAALTEPGACSGARKAQLHTAKSDNVARTRIGLVAELTEMPNFTFSDEEIRLHR